MWYSFLTIVTGRPDPENQDSDNNHLFGYYLSFKQKYSLNSFGIDVINSIIL
jgi:hypothetical protein